MQDDVVKVKVKSAGEDNTVEEKPSTKIKSMNVKSWLPWLLVALAVVGLLLMYKEYRQVKDNPAQAQAAQNSAETQRVLGKVKQVILVEEKDAPTVARVEDPAKLQKANAEFYKNVQKGDYLVIFPKRAIIYRETNNQIVNIAPIINAPAPTKSAETTPATTTKR